MMGGGPPSGVGHLPPSGTERQSSKRLVEEPGGNGGQAQWVGGGGYGGWV
jgi:hypothetical protein